MRFNECIWIRWKIASIDSKSSNLEGGIGCHGLGPIHTWATRCDHEIVRAQKKCSKAIPRHFQNHAVWSHALKCSVISYVTGLHPNAISRKSHSTISSSMGRSLHCKVEQSRVNTLHVKKSTFYIKHHQNGSNFYQTFFMSRYTRYLLHNKNL